MMTTKPATTVSVIVAAVLAIAASEVVVRDVHLQPTEWLQPEEEPRRQEDSQLGWILTPGRTGRSEVGGRTIEYAIDRAGYRVRRVDEPVDTEKPTVIVAGESVMFGEGLTWDESIAAQVGSMLGSQVANVAVHGYSSDQIYLRLERELPRFREVTAVVSIFMTELFGRNLDHDRPHLAPGLVWSAAEHKPRLQALATMVVPFRRDETVARGVRLTHDVLQATVRLARDHHATPLVLIPQFGTEDDAQRALRARIFTGDIPTLVVPLDPDWRLTWDRHPNARAAHAMAAAIAARLSTR